MENKKKELVIRNEFLIKTANETGLDINNVIKLLKKGIAHSEIRQGKYIKGIFTPKKIIKVVKRS